MGGEIGVPLSFAGYYFATSLISPENRTYANTCVRLNFTVEPEGTVLDWIGYSLDGGANVTITENMTVSGLSACGHDIVVYARDTHSNMATSNMVYFILHPGDIYDQPDQPGKVNVLDLQRHWHGLSTLIPHILTGTEMLT